MKIQGIISAAVLTISAVLSTPAFACSPGDGGVLYNDASQNENIGCGLYEFAGANSDSFLDRWTFTVSENRTASISVFDLELDLDESNPLYGTAKIFDTTNLKFTLFDQHTGEFLGWANENETLSNLSLLANRSYTVKVYGDIAGLFGSTYRGALTSTVTEVPVGPTAPLLGSALGLLALRLRKRAANSNV